jgi:hypothetical protein
VKKYAINDKQTVSLNDLNETKLTKAEMGLVMKSQEKFENFGVNLDSKEESK